MSTQVILHGGATSKNLPENDKFFAKFTSLVDKEEVKIAMVYFARDRDRWDQVFALDKPRILNQTTKKVIFTLPESPHDLLEMLPVNDAIYIAGGEALNIEPLFPELSKLKNLLDKKVYLGSSMGAFMASKNYVLSSDEQDTTGIHQGIGLLDINVLAHWDVEPSKEQKLSLLQKASNLPIITLAEGEFKEFTI